MSKHGTNHMYDAGCRCVECREFKREKDRRRRARRKQQVAAGELAVPHGTPAGYDHYNCRCGQCADARRVFMRAWEARNPQKVAQYRRIRRATADSAVNAGNVWTGADLEQVVRRDIPLTELAARLGRTYDACSIARSKAEHDPKWMLVVGTPAVIGEDE